MKTHSVADLFPLMSEGEYRGLKKDIQDNGQREPIWLHDGRIIDGRNRYRACRELGMEPATQEWDGKGSLVAFVVSLNLHRRHLTASQLGAVAVAADAELAKEAKERQRAGGAKGGSAKSAKDGKGNQRIDEPSIKQPQATEQAARLTGANRQYVSDAKKIQKADPALFEEVKAGTINIPKAKAKLRREGRREELKAKAAAVPKGKKPQWDIVLGDCVKALKDVAEGSVRLAFADPPYNIGVDYGDGAGADKLPDDEYLDWTGRWVRRCVRALAPDGSLWVLIGDEYADHMGVALQAAGLHRRAWVKWFESFGVNRANGFNRTSRHLFHCVKDPKRFVFHPEAVTRPSDRQAKYGDKRAAEGGKVWDDVWGINPPIPRLTGTCAERLPDFPTQLPLALLRPVVGCASDPGDLVLDPFCGSGTTLVAAVESGRRALGIEVSSHYAELARLRLKGVRSV